MNVLIRQAIVATGITVLFLPIAVQAQLDATTTQTKLNTRAFNVVRAAFPSEGRVAGIGISFSRDGEQFESTNAGLPRPGRLFTSSATMDGTTTVLLSIVGSFQMGKSSFFFDSPGPYYFKWEIQFEDRDIPFRSIVQEVEVANAVPADLDFISGLGDPDLTRAMFGADFFERQTGNAVERYADPEARALKAIGQLLAVTREQDSGRAIAIHGPRGDMRKAAEMLLSLAKTIPDSSYAPYAAYYAGCCYVSIASNKFQDAMRSKRTAGQPRGSNPDTAEVIAFFQNDPDCAKTQEAFALAVQRADDYLKPRVLYHQAAMKAEAGAFDEAEQLMASALELAPGERTIQKWVDKARRGAGRMRAELEKTKVRSRGVEDSASDTPKP